MKITRALSLGFLLGTSYLPGAIAQQTTGTPDQQDRRTGSEQDVRLWHDPVKG
jgi:hypothetical protein